MSTDIRDTLHSLFPKDADAIHALKLDNAHFRALADRFETLEKEVHRIEAEIEPASDDRAEALKRSRLATLDEIAAMLANFRSQSA